MKRQENNVGGKRENAGNLHFLFYPQCFQKTSFPRAFRSSVLGQDTLEPQPSTDDTKEIHEYASCSRGFFLEALVLSSKRPWARHPRATAQQ